MKKRMMSLMISGAMLLGACYPLTACSIETENTGGEHTHTYSEEWSSESEHHWHAATCVHSDEKKDYAAHEYNTNGYCIVCGYCMPTVCPGPPTYQPGEIVENEVVRAALYESLREQVSSDMGATYSVNFTGTVEDEPFEYMMSDESDLSAEERSPVLSKLAMNCLVYAGGEIVKTESGYTMTADLFAALDKALLDVQTAVSALQGSILAPVGWSNMVGSLLQQPSIENMLKTLLYGITADELITLLESVSDEDTMSVLPEPTSDMGAFDYLWACLRSPALVQSLLDAYLESTGESLDSKFVEAALSGGVASVPLEVIWVSFFGVSFRQSEIVANIQSLRDDLEGELLRAILGEDATGHIEARVAACYGDDYTFVDFDLDATCEQVKGQLSYENEDGESVTANVELGGFVHAHIAANDAFIEDEES